MLQVNFIRENKDRVLDGLRKRNFRGAEDLINRILEKDRERKEIQLAMDNTLAESNAISKQVGTLMQAGKKAEAEEVKAKSAELKAASKELSEKFSQAEADLDKLLVVIPNIPHDSVKAGTTPEENEIMHVHGQLPTLGEDALPHWELIKKYDIIDFELGTKIAGAGFPVYKGKGARLQRALVNFFLDEATKAGYIEIQPPIVVNKESGFGTGQLPDKDGQMYYVQEDELYLIPTAEVPITNIYRDVILKEEQLPVKNVGFTPCFRREAGSWGAHVRGLNRLHQFDKVEIVQIRKPENSYEALEEMSKYVQSLLIKLELPYRVLRLCGGDMGFTSALTYDMEVYSGAQQKWLEVSSVSNFETFQAHRLKLRMKSEGKNITLHTLNGSALALPRIVASILENNQTPSGIRIPKVLHSYTGFDIIN
jgi:seryl-tRNA synthetase